MLLLADDLHTCVPTGARQLLGRAMALVDSGASADLVDAAKADDYLARAGG